MGDGKIESTDSADLRLYFPESLRHSYMVDGSYGFGSIGKSCHTTWQTMFANANVMIMSARLGNPPHAHPRSAELTSVSVIGLSLAVRV
eukprot:scaffold1188_cov124-Isochrysis_galbana.AAC.4